jgi:hypothetical protein
MDEAMLKPLGEPLYEAMNGATFHPNRASYYNEIAFHWPEDWSDVTRGLETFHESKSIKHNDV